MKIVANLDLGTNTKAVNVVDPTSDKDLATKKYVDNTDAVLGNPTIQVFTSGSNATYTSPADAVLLKVTAVGGGGGGGYYRSNASGAYGGASGGGAGQTVIIWIKKPRGTATTFTYTVGTGGAGGVSTSAATSGGATTFYRGSNYIQADGGSGAAGAVGTGAPGSVTTSGLGGNLNQYTGITNSLCNDVNTINCLSISGGDGNYATPDDLSSNSDSVVGGAGGKSYLGSIGETPSVYRPSASTTASTDAAYAYSYGSGGNGSVSQGSTAGVNGSAGTGGILIIEEYY